MEVTDRNPTRGRKPEDSKKSERNGLSVDVLCHLSQTQAEAYILFSGITLSSNFGKALSLVTRAV